MAISEREIAGVRHVATLRGDTLHRIALRELGNASAWVDIAQLNDLRPPYLVDDPAQLAPGVVLTGASILVPAATSFVSSETDPNAVFGIDLALSSGQLSASNGDLDFTGGIENLKQALSSRVTVLKGDLGFHPYFGSYLDAMIGTTTGPTRGQMACFYIRSALLEDDRVSSISRCWYEIAGDVLMVFADVIAVSGIESSLQFNL